MQSLKMVRVHFEPVLKKGFGTSPPIKLLRSKEKKSHNNLTAEKAEFDLRSAEDSCDLLLRLKAIKICTGSCRAGMQPGDRINANGTISRGWKH
jgi:hypothetical protein